MPSKTLTDLAPELLVQILKSSDCFEDVTSFSSTSRQMFIIWKTNIDTICDAILPRVVPCFAQARELIDAQEKAEGDEHFIFGYQFAVGRAQWMLKRADVAAKALKYFQNDFPSRNKEGFLMGKNSLTSADRTDFFQAYYRAMTMAILGQDSLPSQLLSSWDMLDFEQVKDVTDWMSYYCNYDKILDPGIRFDNGNFYQDPGDTPWLDYFDLLSIPINGLLKDLYKLGYKLDEQTTPEMDRPFPFLFPEFDQDKRKCDRGARLADLFPLIREKGAHYNVRYTLSEA